MAQSDSKMDLKKQASQKRIDSPMAKYNSAGQLTCIICNQIIKTDFLWFSHLKSKIHLENKNLLKMKLVGEQAMPISASITSSKSNPNNKTVESQAKTKEKSPNTETTNLKRPATSLSTNNTDNQIGLTKKQKLENLINQTDSIDLNEFSPIEKQDLNVELVNKIKQADTSITKPNPESTIQALGATNALPEGFFDDPELDCKARGVSRSENLEAEYEEFKKIMQTEEIKSDILIEKDDALRDVDRDLEEVDELINRWSKIEQLHIRREELIKNKKENEQVKMHTNEESDDDDVDEVELENVLNMEMRAKSRF